MARRPALPTALLATLLVRMPTLIGRMAIAIAGVALARRRAVRAFRRALQDMDLPPHAVRELARDYPRLNPLDFARAGGRRR